MAITNHERVGKALELLKDGVPPFLERELKSEYQQRWFDEVKTTLSPQQLTFAGTEKNPEAGYRHGSRGDVESMREKRGRESFLHRLALLG